MAVVLSDDFAGTTGTSLDGRTTPVGGFTWAVEAGAYEINNNRARGTSQGLASIDIGMTSCEVSATFNLASSGSLPGLVFACENISSRMGAFLNQSADRVELWKSEEGSAYITQSLTLDTGVDYDLRVRFDGPDIEIYVDDVLRLSYTLNSTEQATYLDGNHTKVGFRGTTTTYDNLLVDDLVTAVTVNGTGSAALSFAASASGTSTTSATAAAPLGFSAGAQGVRETSGSGSAGLGMVAIAAGVRETFGSGAVALGGLSSSAVGLRTVVGSGSSSFGGLTATAVGVREVLGDGVGSFGGLTAIAIGVRETFGSGAAFRIFTATALGSVNGQRVGIGQAALGFTATATGAATGPVSGTAEAALGFTATATGVVTQPTGFGNAEAVLGFTATATGQRETFGTATGAFGFYAVAPVDELVEAPTPIVRPKVFAVTLVARVPASSGPPTFVEVDRLVVEGLSYTHELNRPGSATLGCPIRAMSSAVKERLADLATFPSEVWVYWGSDIVWAGEIQTLAIQDQTVQLSCAGLLGYTWRMGVTADLTYTGVDQFAIAKDLVDHHQDQAFGDYGLDTSGITTSGVERDRTYLRDELHNIGQRLQELGAVINGFDMHVDPSTRELVLSYPERGTDLTASVFFDERNIDSASVALSVGPDDLVTDGSFTGTLASDTGTNTVTYAARSNVPLRNTYGRSWGSANFQNVTVDETVEGHGDAFMNARDGVFFQPGVTIVPRVGADIGDFEPGDTVSYSYDAGLGRQTGTYRVAKVTVDVDASGTTRIRTEFV